MEKDQLCFPSLHAYARASIRPFALYDICKLYRSKNCSLEAEVNHTIFCLERKKGSCFLALEQRCWFDK